MGEVVVRAVLGLGNPGGRYARTRHNAGFLVLEEIRSTGVGWRNLGDREETERRIGGRTVILARPLTYMNRSGLAAEGLLASHHLTPPEMLVVGDDVALPWGRLRVRGSGGAGGHRGLESVLGHVGTEEFPRLRVGVSSPPEAMDLEEFVLEPLEGDLWGDFERVVARAADAVRVICVEGLEAAMNRFNAAPAGRGGTGTEPAGGGGARC